MFFTQFFVLGPYSQKARTTRAYLLCGYPYPPREAFENTAPDYESEVRLEIGSNPISYRNRVINAESTVKIDLAIGGQQPSFFVHPNFVLRKHRMASTSVLEVFLSAENATHWTTISESGIMWRERAFASRCSLFCGN